MWTPQYDIIVETLTGSQFEVTVTEKDTVGYIKSRIQKYEGIPVDQQHLIYNHKELLDKTEIKDIPLVKGSTVKLVLDMKGGPVSARRVVTLPGYDKWFDLSDVLNHTGQDSLPVKLLVYKDCKKNIHRVMKLRADRKNMLNRNTEVQPEFPHDNDAHDDQWLKDNIQTLEKMRQVKSKLDKKKRSSKNAHKTDTVSDLIQDEDDEDDLLKDNYKLNLSFIPNDDFVGGGSSKIDRFNKQTIDNEIEDVFLDGLMLEDKNKQKNQNKPFSLSPRRPVKQPEKSNFSRFFHHRNSSPTLNSSSSPATSVQSNLPAFDYIHSCNLDKNKGFSQSCNYIPDNRTKLRDNIRRNRSFKLIDSDLIIEENESTNRALCASINAIGCDNKKSTSKIRSNSASVHDILEHMSTNKSLKYDESQQLPSTSSSSAMPSIKLNKRWNTPKLLSSSGYENKLFIDKEQSFPLNSGEPRTGSDDYKLDGGGKIENFRVYKMSSDAKNCYELPKLLIREDSPVESFHSSDSQLETIALRGNSPKNVIDPFTKLDDNDTKLPENSDEEAKQQSATNSLLKLYDSATNQNQRETLLNMYETPDGGGGGGCGGGGGGGGGHGGTSSIVNNVGSITMDNLNKTSTWNYHHSDLGLNKLELSFLNEDLANPVSDMSCLRKSNSVLKIASSNLEINKWKNISQFNGKPPEATASLNFINGDVTSSDDDDNDDVFNSCELLNNKSKSVELNEFRMMFGSSPTLLNTNNYNFNPITQSSRLDAVPFQYRRGYSNLNDACLSSSTSDLECFQNNNKKKTYKNKNGNELPSLYRHRNNEHLDYIRSYENLDRTRIVRVRNERVPSSSSTNHHHHISSGGDGVGGGCGGGGGGNSCSSKNKFTTLSRERCLQEEDDDDIGSCDNFLSYSNLFFENDRNSVGCIGAGSNIKRNINKSCNSNNNNISNISSNSSSNHRPMKDEIGGINPIGYPSDENIFNINFDNFEDDVLEIDTMKLFENSIDLETTVSLLNSCNNNNSNTSDSNNGSSNKTDSNHLLLPDIDNKYKNMAVDRLIKIDINNTNEINNNNDNINNNNNNSTNNNNNKKSTKLRCAKCNKKLGVIMIMKCHCENIFCAQHRYAEAHNCTYNFKMEGKKIIAKENPQVIAQKLPKI